jgi:hypothetical protein
MLSGEGTAHTRVSCAAAFAFLADPRRAAEWFARVDVESLPPGPPRLGQTWTFSGAGSAQRPQPVRLAAYDPPHRFAWQTQLPRWRTNIVWTVSAAPAPEGGTTLTLTTRWQPGLVGWPTALLATLLARVRPDVSLRARAQRTIEGARDAVEEAYPAPGPRGPATPGRSTRRRRP